MNSTNQTLLFDRFLIMYDFVWFLFLSSFCILLYTCANVICIKLLLTYLLTFLILYNTKINRKRPQIVQISCCIRNSEMPMSEFSRKFINSLRQH